MQDALRALEADQARADDQHALVPALAEHGLEAQRVVERPEGRLVLHLLQPVHRRDERHGAGGDAQTVIGKGFAGCERDGVRAGVDGGDGFALEGAHAVRGLVVRRTVGEHVFHRRLALQQIGDQRTTVKGIGFLGDQRDFAGLVDAADALDAAERGRAAANDDVFQHGSPPLIVLRRQSPCSDSPARTAACRTRSSCTARTSGSRRPRCGSARRRGRT